MVDIRPGKFLEPDAAELDTAALWFLACGLVAPSQKDHSNSARVYFDVFSTCSCPSGMSGFDSGYMLNDWNDHLYETVAGCDVRGVLFVRPTIGNDHLSVKQVRKM